MIKERTASTECREAVRRLVDALQRSADFEDAVDAELAELSEDAKAYAAGTYLNQAARESLRIVVRAAEIGAGIERTLIHGWCPRRLRSQSALAKGCSCPECSEQLEQSEKLEEKLSSSLASMALKIRYALEKAVDSELRLTETLLNSRFTLRDGTFVSWGDATIAQHEERIELFADLAQTNIEGMARHAKAVELIRAQGAATLRELAIKRR